MRGDIRHIFAAMLAAVSFFVNNTALPTDIMEARNIVTAREMAGDGHWLVPTMNGEPRLEKPPLPTWVAGAIESVMPDSMAAQRAAAGCMAAVWTVFLFLLAGLLSGRRDYAALTAVVFMTCYQTVQMGRTATWDIYCHAFMMVAVYCLARGMRDDAGRRWRWFPAAGIMLGLSFLSKGPVSFYALLLPFIIAAAATRRLRLRGKGDAVAVMTVLAVLTGGWWYAAVAASSPDILSAVVHKETGAWTGHNVRPWWYYWRFFAETGVWAVPCAAALAVPYWRGRMRDARPYVFAVTWMIAAVVLLSAMPEKKMRYLLPLMAPCSLCVAAVLQHTERDGSKVCRLLRNVTGVSAGIAAALLPAVLYARGCIEPGRLAWLWPLFAAAAAFAAWSMSRRMTFCFAAGIGCVFMLAECFLIGDIGRALGNPARSSISATRGMRALEGLEMFHPGGEAVRIELVYEAHRKIMPLDVANPDTVMRHVPFVLVSRRKAEEVVPDSVMRLVTAVPYGTYNDNRHPYGSRHYTQDFINNVTVIKRRDSNEQDKGL